MRKLSLVSLAVLLGANMGFAQSANKGQSSQDLITGAGPQGPFPHFSGQAAVGAPSPGNSGSRIIAHAQAYFDGTKFVTGDSIEYYYNGDRGGAPDIDNLQNDESIYFDESITFFRSGSDFIKKLRRLQYYGVGNRVANLTYQNLAKDDLWRDSVRYRYTYDQNLRLEKTNYERWFGNVWETPGVPSQLQYNANDKIAKVIQPNSEIIYTYDAQGRLTAAHKWEYSGSVWQNTVRHAYAYDSYSRIISDSLQEWNSALNTWENKKSWAYTYAGTTDDVIEVKEQWYSNVHGWYNYGRRLYTYDANHNRLEDVSQIWEMSSNSYFNTLKIDRTYNGYNQPETITSSTYRQATGSWAHTQDDYRYKFYYATYFPTSVATTNAKETKLDIYPIPAADVLNVKLTTGESSDVTIALFDMSGKIVKHIQAGNTANYTGRLELDDLRTGNYLLSVTSAGEKTTKPVVIAR